MYKTDLGLTYLTAPHQVPKSNIPFRDKCIFYKTNTYFPGGLKTYLYYYIVLNRKIECIFSGSKTFYDSVSEIHEDIRLSVGSIRPCNSYL